MELSAVLSTSKLLLVLRDLGIHALLERYEGLSNGTVQGNHGRCTVSLRTYSTELETVTGEGEGRGTVTIGIINEQFRNLRDIHLQALLTTHGEEVLIGSLDVVEQLANLLAKE